MSAQDRGTFPDAVAVVVVRDGRLPVGADEAVAEAGGAAIVIGSHARKGAVSLASADRVWWSETADGLCPGALAAMLAPLVRDVPLIVMPASPDGRDLAPRVAARCGRPLVARAIRSELITPSGDERTHQVRATVSRIDDRVLVPVTVNGPAVVTLVPGARSMTPVAGTATVEPLPVSAPEGSTDPGNGPVLDPVVLAVLEPDPHTMDLADATRVVAGGAGLVAGADDRHAEQVFDLLIAVAAEMGGSAGATRVATDAGWIGYGRQIGTTGVAIDPDLYVALGVSGAAQHVGGLGTPRHIVSVNTDPSCPMTAMANLGLVTDAHQLLLELARRFGVAVPGDGDSVGDLPSTAEHAEAHRG